MLTKLRQFNSEKNYDYFGIQLNELVFITIDRNDCVSLLIKTDDKTNYRISTDLISLSLSESCSINVNNNSITARCHVMSCKIESDEVTKTYLGLCKAFAFEITNSKNSEQVLEFFSNLTQLFKITPALDLSLERQGLWGELYLIRQTGEINKFVSFWHNESTRKFDFAKENYRLEVKTTSQDNRIHIFSHNQLYRDDQVKIVIASIKLKYDDAGLSLRELIEDTRAALQGDIKSLYKLEGVVLKAGMIDSYEVGPCFDESYARSQLYWFNSIDVPRFNQFEPEGVSNTKYSVDLTNSPRLSNEEVTEWLNNW